MKQIEQYKDSTRFNFDNGWSVRVAFFNGMASASERMTKGNPARIWQNWQQLGADAFAGYLIEVSNRKLV